MRHHLMGSGLQDCVELVLPFLCQKVGDSTVRRELFSHAAVTAKSARPRWAAAGRVCDLLQYPQEILRVTGRVEVGLAFLDHVSDDQIVESARDLLLVVAPVRHFKRKLTSGSRVGSCTRMGNTGQVGSSSKSIRR